MNKTTEILEFLNTYKRDRAAPRHPTTASFIADVLDMDRKYVNTVLGKMYRAGRVRRTEVVFEGRTYFHYSKI